MKAELITETRPHARHSIHDVIVVKDSKGIIIAKVRPTGLNAWCLPIPTSGFKALVERLAREHGKKLYFIEGKFKPEFSWQYF